MIVGPLSSTSRLWDVTGGATIYLQALSTVVVEEALVLVVPAAASHELTTRE